MLIYADNSQDMYAYSDGKLTFLDSGIVFAGTPYASGDYICYQKSSNIYMISVETLGKEKIASNITYLYAINYDKKSGSYSMLFLSGGEIFYVEKGGDPKKLGINVDDTLSGSRFLPKFHRLEASTILDSYYIFYDYVNFTCDLYYIGATGEAKKIANGIEFTLAMIVTSNLSNSFHRNIYITADAKTVFYLKSGSIYKYTVDGDNSAERIAADATKFWITSDGKSVYYSNNDSELYVIEEDNDTRIISDNVDESFMTHDDVLLLLDYDGILYVYENGGNRKVAENVTDCMSSWTMTYYVSETEDKTEVYIAEKGANFKLLLTQPQ